MLSGHLPPTLQEKVRRTVLLEGPIHDAPKLVMVLRSIGHEMPLREAEALLAKHVNERAPLLSADAVTQYLAAAKQKTHSIPPLTAAEIIAVPQTPRVGDDPADMGSPSSPSRRAPRPRRTSLGGSVSLSHDEPSGSYSGSHGNIRHAMAVHKGRLRRLTRGVDSQSTDVYVDVINSDGTLAAAPRLRTIKPSAPLMVMRESLRKERLLMEYQASQAAASKRSTRSLSANKGGSLVSRQRPRVVVYSNIAPPLTLRGLQLPTVESLISEVLKAIGPLPEGVRLVRIVDADVIGRVEPITDLHLQKSTLRVRAVLAREE